MRSMRLKGRTLACLTASALILSACASSGIEIPSSLLAPCESTVDVSAAQTVGDLGKAIIQGDADLRVCNVKKDAIASFIAPRRQWFWQ